MRIRCHQDDCGTVMKEESRGNFVRATCVKCGNIMNLTRATAPLFSVVLSSNLKLGQLGEVV